MRCRMNRAQFTQFNADVMMLCIFGFTTNEVARLLRVERHRVRHVLRRNGGVRDLRSRRLWRGKQKKYQVFLKYYASMIAAPYDPSRESLLLRRALRSRLKIRDFEAFCLGVAKVRDVLCRPGFQSEHENYGRLLSHLGPDTWCGHSQSFISGTIEYDGKRYLCAIARGEIPVPEYFGALQSGYAEWSAAAFRHFIAPYWADKAVAACDRMIALLNERQRQVIRLYFGLDGPALTRDLLAERCGLTAARCYQLLKLGIVRLRKKFQVNGLGQLLAPVGNAIEEYMIPENQIQLRLAEPPQRQPGIIVLQDLLEKIESIEMSVRLYNSLRNRGTRYVGDIITMNERELLRVKGIGRTCLSELKTILDQRNLQLGTELSPEAEEQYREATGKTDIRL